MGSLMLEEALSAADVVSAQRQRTDPLLAAIARELLERPPGLVFTVARGSSDHAASYFAYLTMQRLGVPVVSLPMSLVTLHHAPIAAKGRLAIALSQSGASPDLVDTMTALGAAGAATAAFVNQPDSALARSCTWEVPLCAGPERSVAATKSYVAELAAMAGLVAHWQRDAALLRALDALPERLVQASRLDWSGLTAVLAKTGRAMVVGRGLGFAVALEAALKLKETSAIQAEAFSSAEIRHGPMALIEAGYPLVVFALRGPEQAGLLAFARDMRARDATVLLAAPPDVAERDLTLATADHEALDPLLAIQTFHVTAAHIAEARGFDPDLPRHLSKVTCTR